MRHALYIAMLLVAGLTHAQTTNTTTWPYLKWVQTGGSPVVNLFTNPVTVPDFDGFGTRSKFLPLQLGSGISGLEPGWYAAFEASYVVDGVGHTPSGIIYFDNLYDTLVTGGMESRHWQFTISVLGNDVTAYQLKTGEPSKPSGWLSGTPAGDATYFNMKVPFEIPLGEPVTKITGYFEIGGELALLYAISAGAGEGGDPSYWEEWFEPEEGIFAYWFNRDTGRFLELFDAAAFTNTDWNLDDFPDRDTLQMPDIEEDMDAVGRSTELRQAITGGATLEIPTDTTSISSSDLTWVLPIGAWAAPIWPNMNPSTITVSVNTQIFDLYKPFLHAIGYISIGLWGILRIFDEFRRL